MERKYREGRKRDRGDIKIEKRGKRDIERKI